MSLSGKILERLNRNSLNEDSDVITDYLDSLQKEVLMMKTNWNNKEYYKSIRNFYGSIKQTVDDLDRELNEIIDRAKES